VDHIQCCWKIYFLIDRDKLYGSKHNVLFRGDYMNVSSLVDQIIYISWLWFISRIGTKATIVFCDWCFNPLSCIHRI
jgi:hypothetical protein